MGSITETHDGVVIVAIYYILYYINYIILIILYNIN